MSRISHALDSDCLWLHHDFQHVFPQTYLTVDELNPMTLLLLVTGCGPWVLTSSLLTKTGRGKDLSNDAQIRVIGSVEPEICMKMLKKM